VTGETHADELTAVDEVEVLAPTGAASHAVPMPVVASEVEAQVLRAPASVVKVLVESYREFQRFLEQQVGSSGVSVEVLQDAFVRGMHKLDLVHLDEPTVDWFYRLLRHAVMDLPRHSGSFGEKLTLFRLDLEQKIEPSVAMRAAIERCLSGLAATLEPEDAALLRGVELDVELDDVGANAGSRAAAKQPAMTDATSPELMSARAALRRQVVSACGTCAVHGRWNCTCGSGLAGYGHIR
jgi:DNA-directed RNA polymerase specialized sigma24 family protein